MGSSLQYGSSFYSQNIRVHARGPPTSDLLQLLQPSNQSMQSFGGPLGSYSVTLKLVKIVYREKTEHRTHTQKQANLAFRFYFMQHTISDNATSLIGASYTVQGKVRIPSRLIPSTYFSRITASILKKEMTAVIIIMNFIPDLRGQQQHFLGSYIFIIR